MHDIMLAVSTCVFLPHQCFCILQKSLFNAHADLLTGMGIVALAKELNVEPLEACRLADSFFASFPGVVQWQQVRTRVVCV